MTQMGSLHIGKTENAKVIEVHETGGALIQSESGRLVNLNPMGPVPFEVGQTGRITFYSTRSRGWYSWEFIERAYK